MLNHGKKLFILFMLLFAMLIPANVFAEDSWSGVISRIDTLMDQALQAYQKGDGEKAKELVNEAYFGPFESERMEQAIRLNISAKRAAELEFQFNRIKKEIQSGQNQLKIQNEMDSLLNMLREDASKLEKQQEGSFEQWLYSFLIIVREGVEAILIISAIAVYLIKSGNAEKLKDVYQSTFVALIASFATAYLFSSLFHVSGKGQEVMEGILLLTATLILISMSYWMVNKSDPKRWKNYIEGKIQESISKGKRLTLWFAVFLAVYREGAETVLFYQAIFTESSGNNSLIWTGLISGSLLLILLFYLIRYGSMRLPLKPFFLGSGVLLFLLAFIFTGEGIKELQEGGLFSSSIIQGLQPISTLGIYPTWEGISFQFILLFLAGVILLLKKIQHKKPAQQIIED